MSELKNINYGTETEAAILRAAMNNKISIKEAHKYVYNIFKIFDIHGENSYQDFLLILEDDYALDIFCNEIYEYIKSEKILEFFIEFLSSEKMKDINKSLCLKGHFIENDEGNINKLEINKEIELLHIIDCEVKRKVTENKGIIKYIDKPEYDFTELEKDFKYANHLNILSEISRDSDSLSRVIFVCESKEIGFMACRYLSSLILDDNSFDDLEEKEFTFANKLPILDAGMINSGSFNDSYNFAEGGFRVEGNKVNNNNNMPWWMEEEDIPLIINMDKNQILPLDFEDKLDILNETHRNIFIVYEEEKNSSDESEIFRSGAYVESILEDISFKFCYDCYKINDPETSSEYIQKVFKDAAYINNYILDKSIDISEILTKLKKSRKEKFEFNSSILQLIKKAVSQKNTDYKVLRSEDFSFLDYKSVLYANSSFNKKDSNKLKESAREIMNKKICGLDSVKESIDGIVTVLKNKTLREKAGLKTSEINNVFCFSGPPGVGKTSMANFFADILFENNLLNGNKFLSINGAELKAPYVGQTASKVAAIFEANDAILIDECYSLCDSKGPNDSFAEEALAQICIETEKYANEKLIIFAGYGGEISEENNKMKNFLNANPGINSRITSYIDFPSYSDEEMIEIFKTIVENSDYELENGWSDIVKDIFMERKSSDSFGNAREARRLFQLSAIEQATRIQDKSNDIEVLKLITCEDLSNVAQKLLLSEKKLEGKKKNPIGFFFKE